MKKIIVKTKVVFILAAAVFLASVVPSSAEMSDVSLKGKLMTNLGGYGMMNGEAGAPVIDSIGGNDWAYLTSILPTSKHNEGNPPSPEAFRSHLIAVPPAGDTTDTLATLEFKGLLSKPAVADGITVNGTSGNYLIATISLPKLADFSYIDKGTTKHQSIILWYQLPLTSSSLPAIAYSMDGDFASEPVVYNNQLFITTTDFGHAMMQGNDVFDRLYKHHKFGTADTAAAYLYVFPLDGSSATETTIQQQ